MQPLANGLVVAGEVQLGQPAALEVAVRVTDGHAGYRRAGGLRVYSPTNTAPMPLRAPSGSVNPPMTNSSRGRHFNLSQDLDRPAQYGLSRRLAISPSSPSLHAARSASFPSAMTFCASTTPGSRRPLNNRSSRLRRASSGCTRRSSPSTNGRSNATKTTVRPALSSKAFCSAEKSVKPFREKTTASPSIHALRERSRLNAFAAQGNRAVQFLPERVNNFTSPLSSRASRR